MNFDEEIYFQIRNKAWLYDCEFTVHIYKFFYENAFRSQGRPAIQFEVHIYLSKENSKMKMVR